MYAILEIFNKQYIARENNFLIIDKIDFKINSNVEFDKVLFIKKNNEIILGNPYIKNSKVITCVLKNIRSKKIKILKFKRRKNYIKNYNCRIYSTKLIIKKIIV